VQDIYHTLNPTKLTMISITSFGISDVTKYYYDYFTRQNPLFYFQLLVTFIFILAACGSVYMTTKNKIYYREKFYSEFFINKNYVLSIVSLKLFTILDFFCLTTCTLRMCHHVNVNRMLSL
jgi:hypothetical protein